MKTTLLLCSAFLATAVTAVIPSCKEKGQGEDGQPAAAETAQPEKPAPAPPTVEEATPALHQALGESNIVTPWAVEIDSTTANEDGSLIVTAGMTLSIKEDIFAREETPAAFNNERKACNESLNLAMMPESVYLMQVGAPTDMITEEDRAVRALPAELQQQADELKALAEVSIFRQLAASGQEMKLAATFRAMPKAEGGWDFSEVSIDKTELTPLEAGTARSSLPENAIITTPDFEETRKAEIRAKIAAFNEAAAPYIKGREDAARTRLAEQRARQEEELKRGAEQAEAEAKQRQEWEDLCMRFITEGRKFSGEWTRDNRFGELTLKITRTTQHDNAIHFIGTIYDTKLPAASLDIAGRCDLSQGGDKAQVDITIYDGQYDPDQPTAEVYDADDSLMVLKLSAEGSLEGVMSCQSWKDSPEKAFNIHLSSKVKTRNKR